MNAARALALIVALPAAVAAREVPLSELRLPPGFQISLYADNVANAREMALGARGTVFVGSMNAGKVYALTPSADGTRAARVRTIAQKLHLPAGVAYNAGALYVSSVDRILRYDDIEERLDAPPVAQLVTDRLPREDAHGWRFIAFGPDGRLYVSIGAPCNVCEKPRYAKIERMDADGGHREDVALGVRNSVGFDWQPGTGKLWFTDNGRDWLGDDVPADELNRIDRSGEHFGFPYCHQGDLLDKEFGKGKSCADYRAPELKLGAHVAALGMRFYAGSQFPAEYKNAIFVAEHGSWNRSSKVGYRLVVAHLDGDQIRDSTVFASGWLRDDGSVSGRPDDVLVMPDGALLVSDDSAGVIYRISYSKP